MKVTIYTMSGCPMCSHAIELCKRANVSFKAILPGSPGEISKAEFKEKYPEIVGFPFSIVHEENQEPKYFTGVIDLAKLFMEKELVKAPKNERSQNK